MHAIFFAQRQVSIGRANPFVEFHRLLLHSIWRAGGANAPQHSCARGCDVDIEDEGDIRTAIADGESVQAFRRRWIEATSRPLIHGG